MYSDVEIARRAIHRFNRGALISDPDAAALARRLGFTPDSWQQDFLTATEQNILLNCSRQSGKSTCTALIALFEALTVAGALILLLSPSLRQSGELIRKVYEFYGQLGHLSGYYFGERETILTLELSNGSRIVSLPGREATVRGFSNAHLVVIDEAARVEDTLFYSVMPMLAVSNGRLMLLSTPYGRKGFYWESWDKQKTWRRFEIPASMCPRISPEFLEQQRLTMGEWWASQEFDCVFQDSQTSVFRQEDIAAMFREGVTQWKL